ncbi:MAG: outer membrane protein transport protein [Flavobacteriaceae bacterium]
MKKITFILVLAMSSFGLSAQSLGYEDLSILFSQDEENGTARFVAMGGAFGALGGDISSININPAGLAMFNNSSVSASLGVRNTNYRTNYYTNNTTTNDDYFSLSNVGAVLVFDDINNSDWTNFAIGVNYRIKTDFDNYFTASGNSGFASFDAFPLDINTPALVYDTAENQTFNTTLNGEIAEYNFVISAQHKNKLNIGAAVNTYSVRFNQRSTLLETNNDGNGNTLDANFYQESFTTGTGFSLSAGILYRASDSFRFGLSYQSPTWYTEMFEETNITNNDGYFGDTIIEVSNDNVIYDNTAGGFLPSQSFAYRLRTPGKLTASAAIVFGRVGLISFDYTSKNYQGLNLTGADFSLENQFFDNQLRSTNNFNIGTEWRLANLSLRGGYSYQESPDINAIDTDNLKRYSLGAGYSFGNVKIDFAYSNDNRTGLYNFYPQFSQVNAAEIEIDNRRIVATLTIGL